MEKETLDIVKTALSTAAPLITETVKTYITPKLTKHKTDQEHAETKANFLLKKEDFEKYLTCEFSKHIVMNPIALKKGQCLLDKLYIPLTIKQEEEEYLIDQYPNDLIDKLGSILIVDNAGMGKSTILKKMFTDVVRNKLGFPIFINLRRITSENSVIQEIHKTLNPINKEIPLQVILDLLAEGEFIFFLDGYDEIKLDEKEQATADIQDFIHKTQDNLFFLTSREVDSLTSFEQFSRFSIVELSEEQAYDLIRAYDNNGELSQRLIKTLESEPHGISEFLGNPLLVSLLYAAFQHKEIIPQKKHLFYRQVYDALFERHDLSKGDSYVHDKKTGLDTDNFFRVLRFIGFWSVLKQQVEYDKNELIKIIDECKSRNSDLAFNSSDFLSDLLTSVPLIRQEGGAYLWNHKSLMEYFAAEFIASDAKLRQPEILGRIYEHSNLMGFYHLLDLFYDIDYPSFRRYILKPLLEEFIKHISTPNLSHFSDDEYRTIKSLSFLSGLVDYKNITLDIREFMRKNRLMFGSKSFALGRIQTRKMINMVDKIKQALLYILYRKNSPLVREKYPIDKTINFNQNALLEIIEEQTDHCSSFFVIDNDFLLNKKKLNYNDYLFIYGKRLHLNISAVEKELSEIRELIMNESDDPVFDF